MLGATLTLVALRALNLTFDLTLPGKELFTDARNIGITAVFLSVGLLKRGEAGVKGDN